MNSKNAISAEKLLGTLSTEIVGIQYYDAEVHPGETVHFEREPDNLHDTRAIRVENLDFRQVGHLPRRVVAWLAPLIDHGKVRIDGITGDFDEADRYSIPLELSVYLCPKGRPVLQRKKKPYDSLQALHECVLQAYLDVDEYNAPDITLSLGERLSAVLNRDILPETHLLVHLFPSKAETQRKSLEKTSRDAIIEHLKGVDLADPVHYHNLTMYPLMGGNGRKSPFSLLETAIKKKTAEVQEISETGSVPYVKITNHGTRPILLPEGEILIGAKQNRVINISLVATAKTSTWIPVSCVEQGRWSSVSSHFQTGHHATPRIRAIKTRSVQINRQRSGESASDQGAVWEEVDSLLRDMHVSSQTADLTEAYGVQKSRLKEYKKRIPFPAGARGAIFASGKLVLGVDMFDSSSTFKKYWKKLTEAYFLEASHGEEEVKESDRKTVNDFLDQVRGNIAVTDNQLGDGVVFDLESDSITGSGVWFGETVCHLSAFTIT